MTPLRQRMSEDMQIRDLSPHTQRAYLTAVAQFAQHFGKSPTELGPEHVRTYQLHLLAQQRSRSAFIITVSALRFLYQVTLERDWALKRIPYPHQPKKLPIVLSPSEVAQLLAAPPGIKPHALLATTYAAGLRVSEVVGLRVSDIDSQRMVIRVGQGKGRKDRYVMLSPRLLGILRTYWRAKRPADWLFPGNPRTKPMVTRIDRFGLRFRIESILCGIPIEINGLQLRHREGIPQRIRWTNPPVAPGVMGFDGEAWGAGPGQSVGKPCPNRCSRSQPSASALRRYET